MPARVRVMAWRGIPAQVKAEDDDGGRAGRPLPPWFAQEIDRVAMRDGLAGTDAYLEHWAWSEPETRPGTAAEAADAVVAELLQAWNRPAAG